MVAEDVERGLHGGVEHLVLRGGLGREARAAAERALQAAGGKRGSGAPSSGSGRALGLGSFRIAPAEGNQLLKRRDDDLRGWAGREGGGAGGKEERQGYCVGGRKDEEAGGRSGGGHTGKAHRRRAESREKD